MTISAQKRRLNELLKHQLILTKINSKINDIQLNIESSSKPKLNSGAVARDESEKLSRVIQPSNAMYPPEYYQVDSHRYVINQRIAEMKHNFKIDESNDPREEVNFFEESCEVNEIYNSHDRYKILTSVWPPNDIKNIGPSQIRRINVIKH